LALGVTAESLVDNVIRLLDELIEEFKQLRSLLRTSASSLRDDQDDNMEFMQVSLEQLVAAVQDVNARGSQALNHARTLRGYLKDLTVQQYRSLSWYASCRQSLANAANTLDSVNRAIADATPLMDELLHYLVYGDTPFVRSRNSSLSCDRRQDACGVCGGNNGTCVDCKGVVGGPAVMTVCGNCSDNSAVAMCSYFCDGSPDSGKVLDMCGVCGGDDSSCSGCDGIVNSGRIYDRCGVCDGDGMSCDKATACAAVVCLPVSSLPCPVGQTVSSSGYQGCCFDPSKDCVAAQ